MEFGNTITLRYSGLSSGEIEILFNMLHDPFDVKEEIEDIYDENYVSVVKLDLPLQYNKSFLKIFGMDRWEQVKEVLKNLKWRRGKKGVKLSLAFAGRPKVLFAIHTDNNKIFGKALDTVEYLMDIILFQVDSKRLPTGVREVYYEFDEDEYRWLPIKAIGDKEYTFVREQWVERNIEELDTR
ncbi:MAG: hypothetical protein QXU32_06310 [Nitrososphaerales archaeon]